MPMVHSVVSAVYFLLLLLTVFDFKTKKKQSFDAHGAWWMMNVASTKS